MFGKIKTFFAYFVAVVAIIYMIFTFVGMDKLEQIILATGLHPTYWYSGGQPEKILQRDKYEVVINRPVFKTVFGDAREGFVQISFKGQPALPAEICEKISVDAYAFTLAVDTNKLTAWVTETDGYAKNVQWVYLFDDKSVVVRIALKNKR